MPSRGHITVVLPGSGWRWKVEMEGGWGGLSKEKRRLTISQFWKENGSIKGDHGADDYNYHAFFFSINEESEALKRLVG